MRKSSIHLEWDSTFLGFKVAKIIVSSNNKFAIEREINKLKTEKYRLIYLIDENINVESSINKFISEPIDTKIVYRKKIELNAIMELKNNEIKSVKLMSDELIELALISGEFSRFKTDENFEQNVFKRLYCMWVTRSLNKEIADEVLGFYDESEELKGMITIKLKETEAKIGLLAVFPELQGKGVGKLLLQEAERLCLLKNIHFLTVETQFKNAMACRFYEKNGFTLLKKERIYHLWL